MSAFDDLVPIAHWTTPPFMPRRFSTWFFVTDLPPGTEPRFAEAEVVGHRWVTPSDALDRMAAGEIAMWVPTTSVLERLIEIDAHTVADVAARLRFGPLAAPRVLREAPDHDVIEASSAGGLPGRRCEMTLWGRDRVIVANPGDPSATALDLVREMAERRGNIVAVVLAQPDPDHAAGAEALAIPLDVPVLGAPGGGRRLPYRVTELADGERLPVDIDLRVRLGPAGSGRLTIVRPQRGSDAPRFRMRLRPAATSAAGA